MPPWLAGLLVGVSLFLLLAPGRRPGSASALSRLYARLGAAPQAPQQPRHKTPWVRRLPVAHLVALLRLTLSGRYRNLIVQLIQAAGLEQSHTYDDILGMKVVGGLGCWLYGGMIMLKRPDPMLLPMVALLSFMLFAAPDTWLSRAARVRQDQIRRELPAFLSALAVALEAGLHLIPAVGEATRDRRGMLAAELRLALAQCERGMAPSEALERVSDRLEVSEVTATLAGLLQAFEKGSGHVVQTVRQQAAEAWQQRRRRAEMLAQTASMKLFLPMALLSLPGFVIFLLGPAVLEMIRHFGR